MKALIIKYKLSKWILFLILVVSAIMMIPTKTGIALYIVNAILIFGMRATIKIESDGKYL